MYGFNYATSTLSVTTTFNAERESVTTETLEGISSPSSGVLNEPECVILFDETHRRQGFWDLQKARVIAYVKFLLSVRCVTEHDGYPIAHTEALNLRTFPNMVTGLEWRDSSLLAVMKFLLNLSAAFQKENGAGFVAVSMVGIFDDMVASDFLAGNSRQIYYHYIGVTMVFQQLSTILDMNKQIAGKEAESWTLGTTHLDKTAIPSS